MKTKSLYRKLSQLQDRAQSSGVDIRNPMTTIERKTDGRLILTDPYGNKHQEIEGWEIGASCFNAPIEEFPESFPKIRLSKLTPLLATAHNLGRPVKIKLKKREFQLHIGGTYVISIPLPSG
jgi:hypothetical protein